MMRVTSQHSMIDGVLDLLARSQLVRITLSAHAHLQLRLHEVLHCSRRSSDGRESGWTRNERDALVTEAPIRIARQDKTRQCLKKRQED